MDWYLEDRKRLEGQPKRAIVDYVESQGILVPRRFDSLKEARRSKRPILIRSEHHLEYDKISGLLDTFPLGWIRAIKGEKTLKKVVAKNFYKGDKKYFHSKILLEIYGSLTKTNPDDLWDQLSFSFWEKLGGVNRTIVADSSIKGRYHIQESFSAKRKNLTDPKPWSYNNFIVENRKVVLEMVREYKFKPIGELDELIAFYERIRNLPRFDKNNCPLIEVQNVDGKNYFLQYRRGRDFDPVDFEIDRPPINREVEALFVRGHTPKEGYTGNITVRYPTESLNYDD
jgi:hypothetical protein